MKDWKTICKKILFPPIWLMMILAFLSAVSLIAIFIKGWETSLIAIICYVIAFYSLSVICILCAKVLPDYYRNLKQKVYGNKYGNRYMIDVEFRTHVSLYSSLAVNLLYVATNLFSGLIYQSAWFGILAAYYSILAVMRFLLVRYVNKIGMGKERVAELKRSRLCSVILLTVNLALSGAVLMILYQDKGFEYNGILIYVMAMYTFYITVSAIINAVKYRKYNSPIMSASKVISLAAALVSMLSLETAMLSQFATETTTPYFKKIMIAATGGGISIIVLAMSGYMIIRSTLEIKKLKQGTK